MASVWIDSVLRTYTSNTGNVRANTELLTLGPYLSVIR